MTDILKHDTSFCMFISGYGRFLTFFYFPNVFYFKKTLAKFRAASGLTRSTFKITATKKTYDFPVACRMTRNASA